MLSCRSVVNEVHHLQLAVSLPQSSDLFDGGSTTVGEGESFLECWADSLHESPRSHTSSESSYSFESHVAHYLDESDTDADIDTDGQSDFEDEPFQPSNYSADLTQLNETLRGGALPAQVGWLPEWRKLVDCVRRATQRVFWEVFAGVAVLTAAFQREGWQVAPPIDILYCSAYDLLNPLFLAVCLGLIAEGRIGLLHVGPPCSSFSMACNRFLRYRLRSTEHPEGIQGLRPHQQEKVRLGNALAEIAVKLCQAQQKVKRAWQFEQPSSSLMLLYSVVVAFFAKVRACWAHRDVCCDGAPWKKSTCLVASHAEITTLNASCNNQHSHIKLEGQSPSGENWTAVAGPYWPEFARKIAKTWAFLQEVWCEPCQSTVGAGLLESDPGVALSDIVEGANFVASGKRSTTTIARRVSAGLQPSKRALPQLVPDGLGPAEHLVVAQNVVHPYLRPPEVPQAVKYALRYQVDDIHQVNLQRESMTEAVVYLQSLCQEENLLIAQFAHPLLVPVLVQRDLIFMRELQFITGAIDFLFLPNYIIGMPMFGWALHAPTQVPRLTPPEKGMEAMLDNLAAHNARVIAETKSTGDPALDQAAWKKTEEEIELGCVYGPFEKLEDIPADVARLAKRFPIWEQHGGAVEPTARVIDDLLDGGQNSTTGMQYTHRPCDLDTWSSHCRATQERFPEDQIQGFTSDYSKAFKQGTSDPQQAKWVVLAQWHPHLQKVVFLLTVTQLFGGKAAPLNFARCPDWSSMTMAVLFAVAFSQCVDDLLCCERKATVMSAWVSWRTLAQLCGWRIPDEKSPLPAIAHRALGAWTDFTKTPSEPIQLGIVEDRCEQLSGLLIGIKLSRQLLPGFAGQMWGKLGFSVTQRFGKFGLAKLRPFMRRQHERGRVGLNTQLLSAINWWLDALQHQVPREVPFRMLDRPRVVSYSDGEGSYAGIGIALWSSRRQRPLAGYIQAPPELRRLWSRQQRHALQSDVDIFEIEAAGPALILSNWGEDLREALWIHFIDNSAGQGALVRGSSSVHEADLLVGYTWQLISEVKALPWFDRVESSANPVDGLSRGRFEGDWQLVPISWPQELFDILESEG